MGNVAIGKCTMYRSTDIDQKYVTTLAYYQCNSCGERFLKDKSTILGKNEVALGIHFLSGASQGMFANKIKGIWFRDFQMCFTVANVKP